MQDAYETINHLIRDLQLDKAHWINAEALRFVRKDTFARTQVKLQHVPEELLGLTLKCPNGHDFKPDWLKKRPPVSVFYKDGRGLLKQCACQVQCSTCGVWVNFDLPQRAYKGEVRIFGDEAFRTVDGKSVFVYSFVSHVGGSTSKKSFEQKLRHLKQEIAPKVPPDAWVLHMTELLSPEKRLKKGYLRHLDATQARQFVKRVMAHVSGSSLTGELRIHVAIGITEKGRLTRAERQASQENVYSSALLRVIQEMTKAGLAPMFYFERTQSDGWAKNLFESVSRILCARS